MSKIIEQVQLKRPNGTEIMPKNTIYDVFVDYGDEKNLNDKLVELESEVKTYADSVGNNIKNDLLNGAGTAYDTLKELGDLIDENTDAIDALETVAASKQPTITGAATTITSNNLTANRALVSNDSGKITISSVTSTELGYLGGVTSAIQTQLNAKANKADIATTKSYGASNSATIYVKISDFGSWGTGTWSQKGFSMLISSRAGETVWVNVAADDSNTNAKAIRLLNTYSKIVAIYYSVSESAIYIKANAWCNNICAHLLTNIYGDYVPTVAEASALASDAVEIPIVEFGAGSSKTSIGHSSNALILIGSATRPTYNSNDMALYSDVTALDTRLSAIESAAVSVLSGTTEPTSDQGSDGDIYLVLEE